MLTMMPLRGGGFHVLDNIPLSMSTDFKPGLMFLGKTNILSSRFISKKSSAKKSMTHYYDVLGISPSANQNQIKSAYYKLSKLHHPDVTECSKSHKLFTEISEAYETLGNLPKRRMYDRGMGNTNTGSRSDTRSVQEEINKQSFKTNSVFERGNKPPPPTGRSKIYNFDEFYRQHYNDIRERKANEYREFKKYQETKNPDKLHESEDMKMFPVLMFGLAFVVMIVAYGIADNNYDSSKLTQNRSR